MNRYIDVKDGENAPVQSPAGKAAVPSEVIVSHEKSNGNTLFENVALRSGLRMIVCNHAEPRGFRMAYEIERAPLAFSFNFSQKIRLTIHSGTRGRRVVERLPGSSVLAYMPQTRGVIESPGGRVAGVALYFSVHAFRELFEEIPECLKRLGIHRYPAALEKRFFQQSPFNGDTRFVLQQVFECPYQGELRRLFFEAKSLELVALQLSKLECRNKRRASVLNRHDLDRVREARHALLARLDAPPSLADLSRLAGINRNKLNRGFKQLYGKTAFNVLRDARLTRAWRLLKQNELSLTEVALTVGYNSHANFTKAFRTHFGQTPKTVSREELDAPPFEAE